MYGPGNYAPQFGQSPNRPPRPPFLQKQGSHPPAPPGLLHQRAPVPPHGVIQPAGQQPHAVSQGASAYHSVPMAQSFRVPYPAIQRGPQSAQYVSALQTPPSHSRAPLPPPHSQNLYRLPIHQTSPSMQQMTLPLSAPALPPPPPMLLQSSSVPSPATFHSRAPSTSGGSHTSSVTSQLPPLPPSPPPPPPLPPPPPSSIPHSSVPPSMSKPIESDISVHSLRDAGSSQDLTSESAQNIPTHDRNRGSDPNDGSDHGILSMQSVTGDVPTPPPRPTNEKTLRNIEVLCQYISKNGPAFEDMARKNQIGNPEFNFLFGGEPGSEAAIAHDYYTWLKKESSLGQVQSNISMKDNHVENRSSMEPNNAAEASYSSLSDSDMDMEDDIIQPGEKLALNNQVSDLKQDIVSAVDEIKNKENDNLLQISEGSESQMKLVSPIKLGGDDGGRSNKSFGSMTRTEDPFTLLKEYASNDSSEGDADLEVPEPASTLTSNQCKMQNNSERKAYIVGLSGSIGAQGKQPKDIDYDQSLDFSASKVIPGPSSLRKESDKTVENSVRVYASKQSPFHDLEEKGTLESSVVVMVSQSGEAQRKHKRSSASANVDEFGRLIRDDASDIDSDNSSYYRRHGRRGRSRSTSRSPIKRRRRSRSTGRSPIKRRRSPWRRKERRSSSQSWSPKRRRSRSRSPLRRVSDIGSKRNIRGRHQMGECFNYIKGRCYRGASCKYLHSDPDRYSESRQYRSKHHGLEMRTRSREHDYSEENKVATKKGSLECDINGEETQHDDVKDRELEAKEKQHVNSDYDSKGTTVDERERIEYVDGSVHYGLVGRDGSATVVDQNNDTTPKGSSSLLKTSDCEGISDLFTSNHQNGENSEQPGPHWKKEDIGHSQVQSSKQDHHTLDKQSHHLRSSCPTLTTHIAAVSSCQPSEAVLPLCKKPVDLVGQKDLLALISSAANYSYLASQLPPPPLPLPPPPPPPSVLPLQPPPPPSLHVASIPHVPQPVQDSISVPLDPTVLLSNQQTQYRTAQNLPWSILPPPFPPNIVTPPVHSGPASFQLGSLPLRSDPSMQPSLKTNPTHLPIHPRVGSLQEQTYPMQGSHQPPQHVDAMRPGNLLVQPVAGTVSGRDDRCINSSHSGPSPSSIFPHGNIPPRAVSTSGEGNFNKLQSFSHGTLLSGEPSSSGYQNPPHLQQHQSHGLYQASGDSFRDPSHYSADIHGNHLSHISDTGSRIIAHYNPYASTFDQPLNSNFGSDVFRQGKQPYGSEFENSLSLGRAPFESKKVTYEASPVIPSPNSSRAGGQAFPKSGGDQYDPLFDSIEPSAESLKKQSEQDDHAADNSDIMLRLSGSKPSDAKVNRKQEEPGVVAAATSSDTDEFGETAHDEVVAAEAGSQSNLNDGAVGASGDFEIDQVKREGKSKKNKDSRSMKLFKVELASFVKDMLKPSWRQGNMSKEAFKTIVQKTVEKVSGAMKGHRAPKSKAKIEQYIDRSQWKLTALVEGYVNKYAKA